MSLSKSTPMGEPKTKIEKLRFLPIYMMISIIFLILSVIVCFKYINGYETCTKTDKCIECTSHESNKQYCQGTGRKQEYTCLRDKGNIEEKYSEWRECNISTESQIGYVILFQLTMISIGGFAYWQVTKRRLNTMTRFDYRKVVTSTSGLQQP